MGELKKFDCELYRDRRRKQYLSEIERRRLASNRRRWNNTVVGCGIWFDIKWSPPLNYTFSAVPYMPHQDYIDKESLGLHHIESLESTTCKLCHCEFEYKRYGNTEQCKRTKKFGDVIFVLEVDDPPRLCPECNKIFDKQYQKLKLPEKCNGTPGRERKDFIKEKYQDLLDVMTIKNKIRNYGKQRQKEN